MEFTWSAWLGSVTLIVTPFFSIPDNMLDTRPLLDLILDDFSFVYKKLANVNPSIYRI
jgi:hypothetical protein